MATRAHRAAIRLLSLLAGGVLLLTASNVDPRGGIAERWLESPRPENGSAGWHDTWEAAALSHALERHGPFEAPHVDRVAEPGVGDRVRVRSADGYCAWYGGLYARATGWKANEVASC